MTDVSNHLPPTARDWLVKAAATPLNPSLGVAFDQERRRAVDAAIDRVKLAYPTYFKEQDHDRKTY